MFGAGRDPARPSFQTPRGRATAAREVAFLHSGKTGGTQLRWMFERLNAAQDRLRCIKHPHRVRLADLPGGMPYLFSIRRPAERFRSAFHSRLRQGRPRYDAPWSAHEAEAFARFPDANALAEALFARGPEGAAARAAIGAIHHACDQQCDRFAGQGFFLRLRPPLWIIRQERLAEDAAALLPRLGVEVPGFVPSDDPVVAHANDYAGAPSLSAAARENLARWYARDEAFYDDCEAWLADPGEPAWNPRRVKRALRRAGSGQGGGTCS